MEKKEKGTKEWIRVTTFPIPTTDFVVPSLSDGQTYDFRVLAVNEGGVSKPSKTTGPVTATRKMCKYSNMFSFFIYLFYDSLFFPSTLKNREKNRVSR